jgi:ABC-2 type transport system ATP-binding protein
VDTVVQASHADRQTVALVRTRGPIADPAWSVREVGLEELVLAYLAEPDAGTLPGPRGRVA